MSDSRHIVAELSAVITERARTGKASDSWTARLLSQGTDSCCRKLGEETLELILAAKNGEQTAIVSEAADVVYHLLVLLEQTKTDPDDVWRCLQKRLHISGLDEKAARKTTTGQKP